MTEDEKKCFSETFQKTLDSFAEALRKRDFIECIKKVGVLECFGFPDVEYYTGLAYHCNGDYLHAIPHMEMIDENSMFYSDALNELSIDYSLAGQYEKLCNVLSNDRYKGSKLEQIERKIVCLENVSADDFPTIKGTIDANGLASLAEDQSSHKEEVFFRICKVFSLALVVTGECINQCLNYQLNNGKDLAEFQPNSDVSRLISEYEKWCSILTFSSQIKNIKFADDNIASLADCALQDRSWPEKLRIFKETDYANQIIQIILALVRPEQHPTIDPYDCVESFLEAVFHIFPKVFLPA